MSEPQLVAAAVVGARVRSIQIPCRMLKEAGGCSCPANWPLLTLISGTALPRPGLALEKSIATPGGILLRGAKVTGAAVKLSGVFGVYEITGVIEVAPFASRHCSV